MKTFQEFLRESKHIVTKPHTIDIDGVNTKVNLHLFGKVPKPDYSNVNHITVGGKDFFGSQGTSKHKKTNLDVIKFKSEDGAVLWITPDLTQSFKD